VFYMLIIHKLFYMYVAKLLQFNMDSLVITNNCVIFAVDWFTAEKSTDQYIRYCSDLSTLVS